ncbi:MAG: hypothetical protein ACJ8ER_06790 [Allosphingosinicella sp.]
MAFEALFARLAAAALVILAATTLFSLQLLAPSQEGAGEAGPIDIRSNASFDLLAAATRL